MKNHIRSYCVAFLVLFGMLAFGGCRSTEEVNKTSKPEVPGPELAALAERAEEAMAAAGDSVGREYANRLGSEHRPAWIKYFKSEGPKPSRGNQKRVVRNIKRLIGLIEAAEEWPAPGRYTIPRAPVAPVIDGKLDEKVWKQAAMWDEIYPFNKREAEGPKTIWRVLWDEQNLYFGFECADEDIVAPDRKRDGHIYFDDCVEMFILPVFRFRTYWEIVIAPNGCLFDSAQCKHTKKWGCISDRSQSVEGMQHAENIRGTLNDSEDTDEGYTVEVAIPFSQLPGYTRCGPKAGDQLHFMLVRLDRINGEFKTYAFRPLQAWGHNIWNHAVMELGKAGSQQGTE
ncbi:MAG: carbohydrate-binding family 9-like protein [Planctomycetes bacterium]|nr:carbohydrate-binding family 9-like protein [Planctomycetota bacterium]